MHVDMFTNLGLADYPGGLRKGIETFERDVLGDAL